MIVHCDEGYDTFMLSGFVYFCLAAYGSAAQSEDLKTGMLNSDESLSDLDLAFSKRLVDGSVTDQNIPTDFCIDFASGIGRIAVNVHSNYYKRIDFVDPIGRFIMKAEEERTGIRISMDKFVRSAQDWTPDKHYNLFS
jgi:hypothetical protein